jgi:hypothetical protein
MIGHSEAESLSLPLSFPTAGSTAAAGSGSAFASALGCRDSFCRISCTRCRPRRPRACMYVCLCVFVCLCVCVNQCSLIQQAHPSHHAASHGKGKVHHHTQCLQLNKGIMNLGVYVQFPLFYREPTTYKQMGSWCPSEARQSHHRQQSKRVTPRRVQDIAFSTAGQPKHYTYTTPTPTLHRDTSPHRALT